MKTLFGVMVAVLGVAGVACGGGESAASGDGAGSPADEQDIKGAACAPITTLECKAGYASTTEGCASPRYVGAPTYGRCVAVADTKVVGMWESVGTDPDSLIWYGFDFNKDGTYSSTGGCRPSPAGPHCFAITHATGKWSTAKSGPQLGAPGGADEITLVDQFGQKSTYFYEIDGKKLSLSEIFRGKASVFTKQ